MCNIICSATMLLLGITLLGVAQSFVSGEFGDLPTGKAPSGAISAYSYGSGGNGAACLEGGLRHGEQERWICCDGCNRCSCINGNVISTRKQCPMEGNKCSQVTGKLDMGLEGLTNQPQIQPTQEGSGGDKEGVNPAVAQTQSADTVIPSGTETAKQDNVQIVPWKESTEENVSKELERLEEKYFGKSRHVNSTQPPVINAGVDDGDSGQGQATSYFTQSPLDSINKMLQKISVEYDDHLSSVHQSNIDQSNQLQDQIYNMTSMTFGKPLEDISKNISTDQLNITSYTLPNNFDLEGLIDKMLYTPDTIKVNITTSSGQENSNNPEQDVDTFHVNISAAMAQMMADIKTDLVLHVTVPQLKGMPLESVVPTIGFQVEVATPGAEGSSSAGDILSTPSYPAAASETGSNNQQPSAQLLESYRVEEEVIQPDAASLTNNSIVQGDVNLLVSNTNSSSPQNITNSPIFPESFPVSIPDPHLSNNGSTINANNTVSIVSPDGNITLTLGDAVANSAPTVPGENSTLQPVITVNGSTIGSPTLPPNMIPTETPLNSTGALAPGLAAADTTTNQTANAGPIPSQQQFDPINPGGAKYIDFISTIDSITVSSPTQPTPTNISSPDSGLNGAVPDTLDVVNATGNTTETQGAVGSVINGAPVSAVVQSDFPVDNLVDVATLLNTNQTQEIVEATVPASAQLQKSLSPVTQASSSRINLVNPAMLESGLVQGSHNTSVLNTMENIG